MKNPFSSKEIPTDEEIADFLGGFSKKTEHPMARKIREINELIHGRDKKDKV